MTDYHRLNVLSLEDVDTFFEPEHLGAASTDSPAMEVVTDFHHTRPLILESDVTVDEADRLIAKAHVHMKLVVDKKEHFLGIVTMEGLRGESAMLAASRRGVKRADLTVADVMLPRKMLHALSYEQLKDKTIGDVLTTLEQLGEQHILVLDEGQNRICGVISAHDIARFLHAPVEFTQRATSFLEVVKALSHKT